MADAYELSKKVAEGKYDSVAQALAATQGDGIKDNVQLSIPAGQLFPVAELPQQVLSPPIKLTK